MHDPWTWTKSGECWWDGGYRAEGNKGEKKKWDNCKSIIHKIYFKKKKKRNFWIPKQFHLKNPHTDLLRHTPSELQKWGSSLKGTSVIHGETECLPSRWELWDSFLPERKVGRCHCLFSEPSHHRATKLAGGYHIWDSINLANTVCPILEIPWDSVPPN